MTGEATLTAIRLFVALLGVAAATAILARRLSIPYTVTLVALGVVAGFLLNPGAFGVTPELVLLVLVPGLVFEAALGLDVRDIRRTLGGVLLLGAPGVLVSAAIVALFLNAGTGLPWSIGIVVGAIVAATDPVAVISTFRHLGAPRRLATIVEGESLFNDGTALVLFAVAVRAVEQQVTLSEAAVTVIVVVVVSTVIGLAAGWLALRLVALVDDHSIELTVSLATAYGTYLLADALHESGIIATVVAGVVIGNYGPTRGLSPAAREALDVVWEFIAYVLTAIAFLLIGIAISVSDLAAAVSPIAWGVVGVLVGRAVVVYGLLGGAVRLFRRGRHGGPLKRGWLHVLFWAGLRGAVAVAMALSLPADFPQRALVQEITFGVVLFTLLVQGTTAERVVVRTGAVRRAAD